MLFSHNNLFLITSFLTLLTVTCKTGEEICEGHNYNQQKCISIGCCKYDDNECFSSVGKNECQKSSSSDKNIKVPTYTKTSPFTVTWVNGVGDWKACTKVGMVFGVHVCVSQKAWQFRSKCNHIFNVLAQLLDNDANGKVDDEAVVKYMIQKNLYLLVLGSDSEDVRPGIGTGQMTGTWFVCGSVFR